MEHLFSDFVSNERKEYILDHAEYGQEDPVREDLLSALKNLDRRKRLIVVLHYYEGYTTKEIAVLAGIKEGTVKSRLHAARIELRRELTNE